MQRLKQQSVLLVLLNLPFEAIYMPGGHKVADSMVEQLCWAGQRLWSDSVHYLCPGWIHKSHPAP